MLSGRTKQAGPCAVFPSRNSGKPATGSKIAKSVANFTGKGKTEKNRKKRQLTHIYLTIINGDGGEE